MLLVNEASYLATGYSNYGREVQERLHASGKYEVAELACYSDPENAEHADRLAALPWTTFTNIPAGPRKAAYNPSGMEQFGGFAFERTCLDFRPDIVWDIRDHWMLEFAERSPFRRFFHWAIMPTVDATPQAEQWLATYQSADSVFCYSDWGVDVLRREGGGTIPVLGSAPPGADAATFAPLDRREVRRVFGIDEDAVVVGTVMRNQGRKLYPQLIRDFARFLGEAPPDLAARSLLYLHTGYPDKGAWDLPRLIKNSGIAHKILVTYKCRACNAVAPQHYQDAYAACQRCGRPEAALISPRNGVDRLTLARVLNAFDAYVQYANSEGFGMPQVEAAACGLRVFATDYSAMADVVRKVGGHPIRVASLDPDVETGCLRARPDPADLVAALIRHLSAPEAVRRKASFVAREGVLAHYDWDRTAARWMAAFDAVPLRPAAATWDSPPRLHAPPPVPPRFPTHEGLVRWAVAEYLGRPDLAGSYMALRLIRDLNWGLTTPSFAASYHNEDCVLGSLAGLQEFGIPQMFDRLRSMCEHTNEWERKRCQLD